MESTIVMRSVSALKCYENNPRHNENAVEKVAESIKEFGFLVPIVIDTNDVIIAALDTPFFYFFTRRRKCKN